MRGKSARILLEWLTNFERRPGVGEPCVGIAKLACSLEHRGVGHVLLMRDIAVDLE